VAAFGESVPWFYLHYLGDGCAAEAGFELSDHLVELFALVGMVLEEAGLAGLFGGEAAEFEFEFGDEAGEFGVFDHGLDDEPESVSVAGGFAEGLGAFPELVVFGDGSEAELADEASSGAGVSEGALEELAGVDGHGFSADEWGFGLGAFDDTFGFEGDGSDGSRVEGVCGEPGEVSGCAELCGGGVAGELGVLADGFDAVEVELPESGFGEGEKGGGTVRKEMGGGTDGGTASGGDADDGAVTNLERCDCIVHVFRSASGAVTS